MAEQDEHRMYGGPDLTPRPDPTSLTNQMILREIAALKENITVRLDAMDKAIVVLADGHEKAPAEVDRRIWALDQKLQERFRSIDMRGEERARLQQALFDGIKTQFEERDERMAAAKAASDTAVAAALQAAKEAVGAANESFQQSINKSEAATNKQIDQQSASQATLGNTLGDKITEIGSRVTRLESQGIGRTAAVAEVREVQTGQRAQSSANSALVFGVIAAAVGIVGLAITLVVLLSRPP